MCLTAPYNSGIPHAFLPVLFRSVNPFRKKWEESGWDFFRPKELKMCAYQRYEQLKKEWIAANPASTNQEYQVAMRRIAEKCGI